MNQEIIYRTVWRRGLIVATLIGALALPTATFTLSSAHAAPLKNSSKAASAAVKSRVNAARSKSVAAKRVGVAKKAASVRSARTKNISAKRAALAKKATSIRAARAKSVSGKKVSVAKKAVKARAALSKRALTATTGSAMKETKPNSKSGGSSKSGESSAATPLEEAHTSGFVPTPEKVAPASVSGRQEANAATAGENSIVAKKTGVAKKAGVAKKSPRSATRKSTKGKRAVKRVRAGL